jgi:hypothetical protein
MRCAGVLVMWSGGHLFERMTWSVVGYLCCVERRAEEGETDEVDRHLRAAAERVVNLGTARTAGRRELPAARRRHWRLDMVGWMRGWSSRKTTERDRDRERKRGERGETNTKQGRRYRVSELQLLNAK